VPKEGDAVDGAIRTIRPLAPIAIDSSTLQTCVFGTDPRLRLRMKRSVIAAGVYVACLLAQWESVRLGLADGGDAARITVFCILGLAVFLFAIRSGLSTRLDDAALTMPQMVFALVSLAFAYHANPACRASFTLIIPLVLTFGAFILPARRCVELGWFAVAVFGTTIGYGAWTSPQLFPPLVEAYTFGYIAVVVPTLAFLAGQLSQLRIDQKAQRIALREAMERLTRMATHDALTGLPNRRHVDERMDELIGDGRQDAQPLCIAILDLDRFKRINDTFGHAAGDEVLRVFAAEASAILRPTDLLARWGGEEFLLVLPATSLEAAQAIIERMRTRMAASASRAADPESRVTFSAGLALVHDGQTLQQALQCADFALYEAKFRGRDRTGVSHPDRGSIAPRVAAPSRRSHVEHPSNVF